MTVYNDSRVQCVERGGGYCLRYGADVDVFVYVAHHLKISFVN